ncbi:MAG: transposase [Cyanobacteria bacterium MAG IRC4_bin_6]|nr:transposase [Cyanobacteria bacterium MAG IRC3_bin_20]MDE0647993.1 transposase [Cyanobacteria bacterium MAG IRC4_bin_6]
MAKAHATRADKRSDHLHKLSTRLIRENQTVVLEDLNVSGMVKNRKMAHAIAGAGWQLLRTLLGSKARMYSGEGGRSAVGSQRLRPAQPVDTKTGRKKDLSVRTWPCSACGAEQDRDVNAAKNILAAARAARLNARGARGSTPVPCPSP